MTYLSHRTFLMQAYTDAAGGGITGVPEDLRT